MNLKIVNEEYKIYSLYCFNDYIVDIKFSNTIEKVIKLSQYFNFF